MKAVLWMNSYTKTILWIIHFILNVNNHPTVISVIHCFTLWMLINQEIFSWFGYHTVVEWYLVGFHGVL